MDNFEIAENKCRARFSEWSPQSEITNIEFEEKDKYSRTDAIYMSAGTLTVTELKNRQHSYKKEWPGTKPGFLFEGIKFAALRDSPCKGKTFIVLFKDAVVIWDITPLIGKKIWRQEWLASTSIDNTGLIIKEWKWVTNLTLEMASHIFQFQEPK